MAMLQCHNVVMPQNNNVVMPQFNNNAMFLLSMSQRCSWGEQFTFVIQFSEQGPTILDHLGNCIHMLGYLSQKRSCHWGLSVGECIELWIFWENNKFAALFMNIQEWINSGMFANPLTLWKTNWQSWLKLAPLCAKSRAPQVRLQITSTGSFSLVWTSFLNLPQQYSD